MIKLFSSSLRNYSRFSSMMMSFQYNSFSTHTTFNWDQNFPYKSILDGKSFQKIAPKLKNFSPENLLEFQKVLNEYVSTRDATLLPRTDASNLATVLWQMGSLAQTAKNAPEAEAYYLEALDITKKTQEGDQKRIILIQNNLGWLYHNMGELDKALICLENVTSLIEATPDFVDFDNVRVRNLYFTGKVLQAQGKGDRAIELFNKMLRTAENDARPVKSYMMTSAYKDMSEIYFEKDQDEKALEILEKGIKFTKDFYGDAVVGLDDLYREAAEIYRLKENNLKVIENIKKSLEIGEKHDRVFPYDFYTLALAQFQIEDYDGLLQNAKRFIDLTDKNDDDFALAKNADLYKMMCLAYYMRHDENLAKKSFSSLITTLKTLYGEKSQEIVDAYIERTDLLSEKEVLKNYYRGALEDAINVLKNNKNLHPSRHLDLLLRAGESYASDEDWNKALKYFWQIQKLSPEKYLAQDGGDKLEYIHIITAKTYCSLEKYEEALAYAEKARALCQASSDPNNRMNDLNEFIQYIHNQSKSASN